MSKLVFVLFLALLALPSMAAPRVGFDALEINAAAREAKIGDALEVLAPLAGRPAGTLLDLRRIDVWAPNAQIVLHTDQGDQRLAIPGSRRFAGRIAGEPSSRVLLTVLESGEVRGLAMAAGDIWMLGSARPDAPLEARQVDAAELARPDGGFQCALDSLGSAATGEFSAAAPPDWTRLLPAAKPSPTSEGVAGLLFDHTAVIAIETDNEFLALGPFAGSTLLATEYIADLVAMASLIYTDEVQTSWLVGPVSLWQTTDPWVQARPDCGLMDYGRYWNINNGAVVRTATHFLSGKSANSGIAWVGVLCRGAFTYNGFTDGATCSPAMATSGNYGGAYAYTSGIDGNFNIVNPNMVWDILAFTHEGGHNFGSPHTHCYAGLNGNANPIDNCYGGECGLPGCYCGSTSLPSGCPGAGQGCATIMSYCHLLGGGNANTVFGLGEGHPYGVVPSRVPTRMRDHVEDVAGITPACLVPQGGSEIFDDGFESGNVNGWSSSAP